MAGEEMWAQVISFEQHNSHAPDIRCQVTTPGNKQCGEPAHWGYVGPVDKEGFYTLWALCERHLRERSASDGE